MSKEFSVRLYQTGDEEGIVDLLKLSFPEWAKREAPLDYWKWKYLDTPLGSVVVVAVRDDKIIGSAHRINFNVKIEALVYSYQLGDDLATHPDFRGMGVYNKIMVFIEKLRLKENKILLSITSNPITINDQIKRGRIIFPHLISHMIRVKNVGLHLKAKSVKNAKIIKFGLSFFKALNRLKNILSFTLHSKHKEDFEIIQTTSFDDRINTFWEKGKDSYNFILEKNSGYMNWRYCDPRAGHYVVKQAVKDGEVLGFIVLELRKDGDYAEGYVADLLALPGRMDFAEALLKNACKYFDDIGVNAVNYRAVKGHPYLSLFSRNGFLDTPRISNMHVIWDFNGSEREYEVIKASHPDKVHFNYGDYL